jgi:hypothetical protein
MTLSLLIHLKLLYKVQEAFTFYLYILKEFSERPLIRLIIIACLRAYVRASMDALFYKRMKKRNTENYVKLPSEIMTFSQDLFSLFKGKKKDNRRGERERREYVFRFKKLVT